VSSFLSEQRVVGSSASISRSNQSTLEAPFCTQICRMSVTVVLPGVAGNLKPSTRGRTGGLTRPKKRSCKRLSILLPEWVLTSRREQWSGSTRIKTAGQASTATDTSIALSRDGVAVSFQDGRSVVPVMGAAACGKPASLWSPAHVATIAVGAKVVADSAKTPPICDVNLRRIAHAELRTAVSDIGEALKAAILGQPQLIIHAPDMAEMYVPFPYLMSLVVDQPEERLLAAKRGYFCLQCSPKTWMEELRRASPAQASRIAGACGKPHALRELVDSVERTLADGYKRASSAVSRHFEQFRPITPLETFAALMLVPPYGLPIAVAPSINVMLRIPFQSDGRSLFTGDPLHLFKLAIDHTLDVLSELLKRHRRQDRYKRLWRQSSAADPSTSGCAGSHKESPLAVPATHNEPQRYAFFLRSLMLTARCGDEEQDFVRDVMVPLAEAITLFYTPHRRDVGPLITPLVCFRATFAAYRFCLGFATWKQMFLEEGRDMHRAMQLSHHNLIHALDAWLRNGTSTTTNMGLFEKAHRDSRAASQAGTRQYMAQNPGVQVQQTKAHWRMQMSQAVAADVSFAPERVHHRRVHLRRCNLNDSEGDVCAEDCVGSGLYCGFKEQTVPDQGREAGCSYNERAGCH